MNKYDINTSPYPLKLNLDLRSPFSKETERLRSNIQESSNNNRNSGNLLGSKNLQNEEELTTYRYDQISTESNRVSFRETILKSHRSKTITLERVDRTRTKSKNRLLQEEKKKNAYIQKCMRSGAAIDEVSSPNHSLLPKNLMRNFTNSNLKTQDKITLSTENIQLDIENQNLKKINKNLILEINDLKNKIRTMNDKTNTEFEKGYILQNKLQNSFSLEKPKFLSNRKRKNSEFSHNNNLASIEDNKGKYQSIEELDILNEVIESKSKSIKDLEKRIDDLIIDKVLANEERKKFQENLLNRNFAFVLACIEIERLQSIILYKEAEIVGIEGLKLKCSQLVNQYKLNSFNFKKKALSEPMILPMKNIDL